MRFHFSCRIHRERGRVRGKEEKQIHQLHMLFTVTFLFMIKITSFRISNVVQLDFKYNDKMQNRNEMKYVCG